MLRNIRMKIYKTKWEKAQDAEKDSWSPLWLEASNPTRKKSVASEIKKQTFIVEKLFENFGINPKTDWRNKAILDVASGSVSYIARNKLGKTREGIDPLKYPEWVYESYQKADFTVHMVPFEKFRATRKYDIIIFYNALQHFDNLEAVAEKCKQLLAPGGQILFSEYLNVPCDHAHIHELTAGLMNKLFDGSGLSLTSKVLKVRLKGLVELEDGSAIKLYVGRSVLAKEK